MTQPMRQLGFTLIELMIVIAIIAIVAAIAFPSLQNARKSANEASCLQSLRSIMTVQQQYRTRFGRYGHTTELINEGYLDGFEMVLGNWHKSGYLFRYNTGSFIWGIRADPVVPGTTGDRWFWVDNSGVIRVQPGSFAWPLSPPLD